jgi:predicted dinucleotide-binding enzyme
MTGTRTSHAISILGAGKLGQAVGQLWHRAGHRVCFGVRSPYKLSSLVESLGPRASAKSIEDAAAEGDIVLLAVPYTAIDEVVSLSQSRLADKIVLDATNPFALSPEGRIVSSLGVGTTAGAHMAQRLPASFVVRCFTHIMDELLVSRGTAQSGMWAAAIAGDDSVAKQIASELVHDAGFVAVDIGTLAESEPLDPGGVLFPHMFTPADMRAVLAREQHLAQAGV